MALKLADVAGFEARKAESKKHGRLRGLGERLDLREVEDVYLPLSRLLHFYVEATHGLHLATSEFLGERLPSTRRQPRSSRGNPLITAFSAKFRFRSTANSRNKIISSTNIIKTGI